MFLFSFILLRTRCCKVSFVIFLGSSLLLRTRCYKVPPVLFLCSFLLLLPVRCPFRVPQGGPT